MPQCSENGEGTTDNCHRRFWLARLSCFGGGVASTALLLAMAAPAFCQTVLPEPEEIIIHYEATDGLADPVARLQKRVAERKVRLRFAPDRGYLPSLLKALRVSVSSQGLVFSKTSSQSDLCNPHTPRAVFFGDDVSVGWVPGGPVIDLAAVDPNRGVIFYTLDQRAEGPPNFTRRTDCVQCHLGPKTRFVPGLIVRSVYTLADGTPMGQVPGFLNGHGSPVEARWGGWYVTGSEDRERPEAALLARASHSVGGTDPERNEHYG